MVGNGIFKLHSRLVVIMFPWVVYTTFYSATILKGCFVYESGRKRSYIFGGANKGCINSTKYGWKT